MCWTNSICLQVLAERCNPKAALLEPPWFQQLSSCLQLRVAHQVGVLIISVVVMASFAAIAATGLTRTPTSGRRCVVVGDQQWGGC